MATADIKTLAITVASILIAHSIAIMTPKKVRIGNCWPGRARPECPPPTPLPQSTSSVPTITGSTFPTTTPPTTSYTTEVYEEYTTEVYEEEERSDYTSSYIYASSISTEMQSTIEIGSSGSIDKRAGAIETDITFLTTYHSTITYLTTDVSKVNEQHVVYFNEVLVNITTMNEQLSSGQLSISSSQVNVVKTILMGNTEFIIELKDEIAFTEQLEANEERLSITTEFQSGIEVISTNLQIVVETITVAETSTISIDVVSNVNQFIEEIQGGHISRTTLETLASYQEEIASFTKQVTESEVQVTLTKADVKIIRKAISQLDQAKLAIEVEINSIVEEKANLDIQDNFDALLAATDVVNKAIEDLIGNADLNADTSLKIPENILAAFASIKESVELNEMVSQKDIVIIKKLEQFVEEFKDSSYSSVAGLTLAIGLNLEIKSIVKEKMASSLEKSLIEDRIENLERSENYLSSILITAESFNGNTATGSEEVVIIQDAIKSISEIIISEISFENTVTLDYIDNSLKGFEISIISLDDASELTAVVSAKLNEVQNKISTIKATSELRETISSVEGIIEITDKVISFISSFKSRVSITASDIALDNGNNIEAQANLLIKYFSEISLSVALTGENLLKYQEGVDNFIVIINNIDEISTLENINQLDSIARHINIIYQNYQNALDKSFSIKSQINIYRDLYDFLQALLKFIEGLNDSTLSYDTGSDIVFNMLFSKLVGVKASIEITDALLIEELYAFYESFTSLASDGDNVIKLKAEKIEFINEFSTLVLDIIDETEIEDEKEEENLYAQELLILISEATVLLETLVEITVDITDQTETNEQLTNHKNALLAIKKNIDPTSNTVSEFRETVGSIKSFVNSIVKGELGFIQVANLEAIQALNQDIELSIKIKLEQTVTSKATLYENLIQTIESTVKVLTTSITEYEKNSRSEEELVYTLYADELFAKLGALSENLNSVDTLLVSKFQIITEEIKRVVVSHYGIGLIVGTTTQVNYLIEEGNKAVNALLNRLGEEKNYEEETEAAFRTLELNDNLKVIVKLIISITELKETTTDTNYVSQFETIKQIFETLKEDFSLVSEDIISKIINFKITLHEILETGKRPEEIVFEDILEEVKETFATIETITLEVQEKQFIKESIRKQKVILAITKEVSSKIDDFINNLELEQIIGDGVDSRLFELIDKFVNLGVANEEKLLSLKAETEIIINNLEINSNEYSNAFELKKVVDDLKKKSEEYIEKLIARETVEEDYEVIIEITVDLDEIDKVVIEKVNSITVDYSIEQIKTDEITTISENIKNLLDLPASLIKEKIGDVKSDIQNLNPQPENFQQINELNSLFNQLLDQIQTRELFLSLVEESTRNLDFTFSSKELLQTAKDSLSDIFLLTENESDDSESPSQLKKLDASLSQLEEQDLSYSFFTTFNIYVKEIISVDIYKTTKTVIKNLLWKINNVNIAAEESTSFLQSVLQVRSLDKHIEVIQTLIIKFKTIVEDLEKIQDNNGEEVDGTVLNDLFDYLKETTNAGTFSVEEFTNIDIFVSKINIEDYTGKKISQLDSVKENIKVLEVYTQEEFKKSQTNMANVVSITTKEKVIIVLDEISSSITEIVDSIGVITEETDNQIISDLYTYILNIDSITLELEYELILKKENLSSIPVTEGIGIRLVVELQALIGSTISELVNNKAVSKTINENNNKIDVYKKTEITLTTIKDLLLEVTIDTQGENDDALFITTLVDNIKSANIQSNTNAISSLTEQIIIFKEKLVVTKEKLKITEALLTTITSYISILITVTQSKTSEYQLQSTKLQQSTIFLETTSVLKDYQNIIKEIYEGNDNGEFIEAKDPKIIEILEYLIVYIKEIQNNVIGIRSEILIYLKENIQVLFYMQSKKVYSKHVSKISVIVEKVVTSLSNEYKTIKSEAEKQESKAFIQNEIQAIENIETIILEFSKTTDSSSETQTIDITTIDEIQRISEILILIQEGNTNANHIADLIFYTYSLKLYIETNGNSVQFINYEKVTKTVGETIVSLTDSNTDIDFAISVAKSTYEAKQVKVLSSSIIDELYSIVNMQENDSGEIYSGSLFIQIQQALATFQSKSYGTLILTFEYILKELKVITSNLSSYSKIQNVVRIIRTFQSVTVSESKSISEVTITELISEKVSIKGEVVKTLSEFRDIVSKIQSSSSSSQTVYGTDEIISFIESNSLETYETILILKTYLKRFVSIEQSDVSNLLSILTVRIEKENVVFSELRRDYSSLTQLIQTKAASKSITNADKIFSEIQITSGEEQVTEVIEVTVLINLLYSLDISIITPVDLKKLEIQIETVLQIVSERSTNIAFLKSVVEQVANLKRAGEENVKTQQIYKVEQEFIEELQISKETLSVGLSSLESLVYTSVTSSFVEIEVVTKLYNLLLSIKSDFSLFVGLREQIEELIQELGNINSEKNNVKYLSGTIKLLQQLINKENNYLQSKKQLEYVKQNNEFKSLLAHFVKKLTLVDYSSDVEEGSDTENTESTQNTFTSEISGITYTYIEIFYKIKIYLQQLSSGSIIYKLKESVEIEEILNVFINIDINVLQSQISYEEIKIVITVSEQAKVKLTSNTNIIKSNVEVRKAHDRSLELDTLLTNIKNSYTIIQKTGETSSYALIQLEYIFAILKNIENAYGFDQATITSLESYYFELESATLITEDIVKVTGNEVFIEFSSIITTSYTIVKKTLYKQESIVSGKVESLDLSVVDISEEDNLIKQTYSKVEVDIINGIGKAYEQSYISKEIQNLFVTLRENLNLFESAEESSETDQSAVGQNQGENDIYLIIYELKSFLKIVSRFEFDISLISTFNTIIQKFKLIYQVEVKIQLDVRDEILAYIDTTEQVLQEVNDLQSAYIGASQSYVNIKSINSLFITLSKTIDQLESDEIVFNTEEISEIEKTKLQQEISSLKENILTFKLGNSDISEEFLYFFRKGIDYINVKLTENLYVENKKSFTYIKNILQKSTVTVLNENQALDKTSIESDYLLTTDALTVLNELDQGFLEFSQGLTGTQEFDSPSRERLDFLFIRIIHILILWSREETIIIITREQITQLKIYLSEISELSIIMKGSASIPQIEEISSLIQESKERANAALDRINEEKYLNYEITKQEKLTFTYSNTINILTSLQQTNIIGESGGSTDPSVISTIETTIQNLTNAFETAFSDPFSNHLGDIPLIGFLKLLQKQKINSYENLNGFSNLITVLTDVSVRASSLVRSYTFERASQAAGDLLKIIPSNFVIDYNNAAPLVSSTVVSNLNYEINSVSKQLYSIKQIYIRKIIQSKFSLQKIIKSSGTDILYLYELAESLKYIKIASKQSQILELKSSESKRTLEILNTERQYFGKLGSHLKDYIINYTGDYQNYIQNEETLIAAYTILNYTFNFQALPRDFGSIIREYDLVSIVSGNDKPVAYIEELYSLLIKYKDSLYYLELLSQTTEQIKVFEKVRGLLEVIFTQLKNTIENLNSLPKESVEIVYSIDGDSLTIADILDDVKKILRNGKSIRYQFEDSVIIKLEYYSAIISKASLTSGVTVTKLSQVFKLISGSIVHLTYAINTYQSAIHNIESYIVVSYIEDINVVIKTVFGQSTSIKGSERTMSIIQSLVENYKTFAYGFSFIKKESVSQSLALVYELKYSAGGDISIDLSDLLDLLPVVGKVVNEFQAIISSHILHHDISSILKNKFSNNFGEITNDDLVVASQDSLISYNLLSILKQADSKLSEIIELTVESNLNNNDDDYDYNNEKVSEIFSYLTPSSYTYKHFSYDVLYQISDFILLLDNNFANNVNTTNLIKLHDFIKLTITKIDSINNKLGGYGETSTLVLLLNEALNLVKFVSGEVNYWINEVEVSCSTYDNKYVDPANLVSLITPFTGGDDDKTLQELFNQVSRIIMQWSYDMSSINPVSVNIFKTFAKHIIHTCGFVDGLHMWEHTLIEGTESLEYVLKNTYLSIAEEHVRLQGQLVKYEINLKHTTYYLEFLVNYKYADENTTDEVESYNSDSPDTYIIKELKLQKEITNNWDRSHHRETSDSIAFSRSITNIINRSKAGYKLDIETVEKLIKKFEKTIEQSQKKIDFIKSQLSKLKEKKAQTIHNSFFNQAKSTASYGVQLLNLITESLVEDNINSEDPANNDDIEQLESTAVNLLNILNDHNVCELKYNYDSEISKNITTESHLVSGYLYYFNYNDVLNATYDLYHALSKTPYYVDNTVYDETKNKLSEALNKFDCTK